MGSNYLSWKNLKNTHSVVSATVSPNLLTTEAISREDLAFCVRTLHIANPPLTPGHLSCYTVYLSPPISCLHVISKARPRANVHMGLTR